MEAPTSAPVASPSNTTRDATRGRGRPRRGRGAQRGGGENAALALRPASLALPSRSSAAPGSGDEQSSKRSGRRGRAGGMGRGRGGERGSGRGSGRGARVAPEARTVNGRTFGGQLTASDPPGSASMAVPGDLQGSAPVFVPGQHHVQNVPQSRPYPPQPKQPRQPKQQAPKSQAPDLATRTHEDIDNGHYECPICTSDVQRKSKVWSCQTCWTVFHLSCIKKWSVNLGSAAEQQRNQNGELPPRLWRCPGCNLPKETLPSSYTCWCGKELEPRPVAGLPPHSCGQSCGKDRVRKCPHPCQLTCHAGPCPPCSHMGPTQSCFCEKHEITKRCSETNYESGWTCGEICGATMGCGEHRCTRPCHGGSCGPCDVRLPARCYCGQMEKQVLCSDRGEARDSSRNHRTELDEVVLESWTGVFDCGSACDRVLDCGIHRCTQSCHSQEAASGHCPWAPDVVTHCSCGKTPLDDLVDDKRTSCVDPIPACAKACDKLLPCGHLCPEICHTGDCPSCLKNVGINCRCGRTTSRSICHQGIDEPPQCMRVCRITLNCGRHMCEEHCCAGERKAHERQANKRKQRPLSSAPRSADDVFEAEHICTRSCGRLLKCGNHVCEELCHKGPCGSCREAIFEEIACNCGRTILEPPLPCGTQPPPCRYSCERPKACGHPQVPHSCHQDDGPCPKCPFLVEKRCMCGKKSLKNQQCWLRDVSCGVVCGKKLKCGVHACRKPCHRAGDCEDANGQQCLQPCGKLKKICGHPDEAPCHAPYPCKEEKPCPNKIFITCGCQAQKQEMKCGASKSTEGNHSKTLPCNDECARLERNRKLAVALNIDQSAHVEGLDHIPYSNDTLNIFSKQVKWAQTQEREFRVFAAAEDEKRLRFKPMQPQQRSFIHSLAEDFGLDSDSVDPEPHRHVIVWKTPRFVSAPNKTLADALRLRQQNVRSANVSANVSDTEGAATKPKVTTFEPFNSFRVIKPRFGLTIDEVRAEVNGIVHPSTPFTFNIEFMPSEEVVLKAVSRTLPPRELEQMLQNLRMPLATAISSRGYGSLQLCTTDSSLNITRYESDGGTGDGWSRVAAKKAAPKTSLQTTGFSGAGNAFAALSGGKVTFAKKAAVKKKPRPEDIADDWEAAELAEEEKEKSAHASEHEAHASDAVSDAEGTLAVQEAIPDVSSIKKHEWADEVEQSIRAQE